MLSYTQFGGLDFEEVENTSVSCQVLEGVECHGSRSFTKTNVPCLRYDVFSVTHSHLVRIIDIGCGLETIAFRHTYSLMSSVCVSLSHTHRYNGYSFPSIILYSVFLGYLGVDRFCLGYTCLGVAKLLTLGGLGVWWVVDVILLLAGQINPADNFSWEQFY